MKKIRIVISAFIIMLCLGSIYAWSIFVPELQLGYGLSNSQTQFIFGTVIAVFTITMIWAAKLSERFAPKKIGYIAALLFAIGYSLAYFSKGNFILLWLGIGLIGGMSTGMGYLVSLSVPVKWFPERKGLITGIVAGGFGGGAIIFSYFAEFMLRRQIDVLQIFLFIALAYGVIIFIASNGLKDLSSETGRQVIKVKREFLSTLSFWQLFIGIFGGTFTGLLIIGNLKPIGISKFIDEGVLVSGIALFSVANLTGRLVWGWLSDIISNNLLIPLSLLMMGGSAILLAYLQLTGGLFLALSLLAGFSFGANFVLFARKTISKFGLLNYAFVYPYVFLGYGIAGVFGPTVGGWLFDSSGSFLTSLILSTLLCLMIAIVYLIIENKRKNKVSYNEKWLDKEVAG